MHAGLSTASSKAVVLQHSVGDGAVGRGQHLDIEAELRALLRDELRELVDGPHLGDLVEDAHLSLRGGVVDGELDAAHGVADVEEAARLAALAVHRQRVAHRRLHQHAPVCAYLSLAC